MTHELTAVEEWAGALLNGLEPAARRKLNLQVAQELRRSQQQRIKAQQAPDGSPYPPRKKRALLRNKKDRIKKQKATMFTKLRTAAYLKTQADANQIAVGFFGRAARIARVHQFGLKDRVSPAGPEVRYIERPLLGLNYSDSEAIKNSILGYLKNLS